MFEGKTALITGSTSGIGLGIARVFAAQGANVILNGFGDAKEIATLRCSIAAEHGVQVRYDGADLSRQDQIEKMMAAALAEFGAIDILVNNAGILETQMRVEDMDAKEREYIVVSMTPRTDSSTADATPSHLNHLR